MKLNPLTISVHDFCHISGLGKTKTYGLIREGKLTAVRIGRRTLISLKSAHDLLAQLDSKEAV